MRLFARVQGAPSGDAVVVPFDNKQKVEDVLKALCGRLSLGDRGAGDNTKESLVGFELRLASNNCLLVPSDLACTVLCDGDYVLVGENGCSCSSRRTSIHSLYLVVTGGPGRGRCVEYHINVECFISVPALHFIFTPFTYSSGQLVLFAPFDAHAQSL